MNVVVPVAMVALIVGGSLYAYFALGTDRFPASDQQHAGGSCRQLTEEQKVEMIDGLMMKGGYDSYDIVAVSDQNCSDGVGLYNANVEAVIDKSSPGEHRKTLRFQIRATHNETKIYEVVLANPANAPI